MNNFEQLFKSPQTLAMGNRLKEIIEHSLEGIEMNIYGGAKVKLALFSRNGTNNVLCGIQEGSKESCMLYVHHLQQIDHERLQFSGKGKHSKRIKFTKLEDIIDKDIKWLLNQVNEMAPY